MSAPMPKLRGIYRRAWKPTVEQCERQIIGDWFSLCSEVQQAGPGTGFAHVMIRRLYDYAIFRQRALRREGIDHLKAENGRDVRS